MIARRVLELEEKPKESELLRFLALSEQIHAESRARWSEALGFLDEIHRAFMKLSGPVAGNTPPIPLLLALNAHATYLSAIRSAVSGQAASVYMALRGTIESSLYAVLTVKKPELVDVWIKRHDSAESRASSRSAFTYANSLAALKQSDESFSNLVNDAYAASIDFGAHPNTKGVMTHVRIQDLGEKGKEVSLVYLYSADSFEVARALLACLETGVLALGILSFALPKLYEERGIDNDTNALLKNRKVQLKSLGFSEDEKFD